MRTLSLATLGLLFVSCSLSIHSTPSDPPTPNPRPAPSIATTHVADQVYELRQVKLRASRSLARERIKQARRHARAAAARRAQAIFSSASVWAHSAEARAVALCESGGNAHNASNPRYRGKWQMGYAEWADEGGTGDPAAAPEAEQDYRAWKLWLARGWQPWQCAT